MKRMLQTVLGLGMAASVATQSYAIGGSFVGNEVPSARAAGQGYVGVAGQNNDPTAVFVNPAAMTSLKGTQITVGGHFENIMASYETDAGAQTKAKTTNVLVPNMSLTQGFMDGKLSAGLAVQSPYGLETNWPSNSSLRYVATVSRLGMMDVTPAVAYQAHPKVSIGAGVDYFNVFRAQLDKNINNDLVEASGGNLVSGSPDATSSLRGDGDGWGYHMGVVVTPMDHHAFGLTYHSKVNIDIEGDLSIKGFSGPVGQTVFGGQNYTTAAKTDLVFPSNVQFGYAYQPTDKWHFEADAAWYHWSELKDINVRFPNATALQQGALGTGGGTSNVTPLNLRDSWSFNTGVNYKVNETWQVRGGIWYEPWATPEAYFTPGFNDLTRYGLSSGLGYAITQNLTIDGAYTAVFMHNRSIHNDVGTFSTNNPGVPPSPDIDGTYKDFANLFAVNLTYRFGNGK
jgi:long-chain fatty acid transport protein